MSERKRRLHHTTKSTLLLQLSKLRPGVELTLRVTQSRRRRDRKRRTGRNRVVITRSDGMGLAVIELDGSGEMSLIRSD